MFQHKDKLDLIFERFNIRDQQDFEDQLDNDELYQDLYDYWTSTGEMPYGTMKARDGDPDQWIYDATCNNLPKKANV